MFVSIPALQDEKPEPRAAGGLPRREARRPAVRREAAPRPTPPARAPKNSPEACGAEPGARERVLFRLECVIQHQQKFTMARPRAIIIGAF